MLALEFVTDRGSRAPAPDVASAVLEHALQSGLILLKAGIHGNCVRVLVSLVATDEQLDEALDIFGAAVEAAVGASSLAATTG
jgi:4-aminobutyrate aminotransferase/(S)-3-amino-2-methylpropionate transaminase